MESQKRRNTAFVIFKTKYDSQTRLSFFNIIINKLGYNSKFDIISSTMLFLCKNGGSKKSKLLCHGKFISTGTHIVLMDDDVSGGSFSMHKDLFEMQMIKIAAFIENISAKKFITIKSAGEKKTITVDISLLNNGKMTEVTIEDEINTESEKRSDILETYFREKCQKNNIEMTNKGEAAIENIFAEDKKTYEELEKSLGYFIISE